MPTSCCICGYPTTESCSRRCWLLMCPIGENTTSESREPSKVRGSIEAKTLHQSHVSIGCKVRMSGNSGGLRTVTRSSRLFRQASSPSIAAPAGLPVVLGAGWAASLAGYGGIGAAPALAEFLGSLPSFPLVLSSVLHALWAFASYQFVLLTVVEPVLSFGR